jgi:ankyrin repeat protein
VFPYPHTALPLPLHPDLAQYKKLAKDLVKACKSADPAAIKTWTSNWLTTLARLTAADDATATSARPDRLAREVEEYVRKKMRSSEGAGCVLSEAQFIIARCHGFASWPIFSKHIVSISRENSPISRFEATADAIVAGDLSAVEGLLRKDPELIRARSTREHRATLLHYIAANGVEDYRQRTPGNAVAIAEALLAAGAEVDAEANLYGGGSTALGLVATSGHPQRAGVQIALLELLLEHGAAIDPNPGSAGLVVACLANGRSEAAEFLAGVGAPLNLEAAAGVGRLEVVKGFFNENGSLKAPATKLQMERGFLWACEYGRNGVVDLMLQHGADLLAQANTGQTGLHWAVIGGNLETVKLLLERGASLEATNVYGGTALGQALWSAFNSDRPTDPVRIIEVLLDAGAKVEDGTLSWLTQQRSGSSSMKNRLEQLLQRFGAKS